MTTLDDLPTPSLVLDLGILKRNLARMAAAVARHPGLRLRPHMKTAKSLAVAELAAPGKGPITGADVQCEGGARVANTDLHIASLTKDRNEASITLLNSDNTTFVP